MSRETKFEHLTVGPVPLPEGDLHVDDDRSIFSVEVVKSEGAAGGPRLAVIFLGANGLEVQVAHLDELDEALQKTVRAILLGEELKARGDRRAEQAETLRELIDLCGLSQLEASGILGISHDTMRQRLSGRRPSTDPQEDILTILDLWTRIQKGDVDSLPAGAVKRAAILAYTKRPRL